MIHMKQEKVGSLLLAALKTLTPPEPFTTQDYTSQSAVIEHNIIPQLCRQLYLIRLEMIPVMFWHAGSFYTSMGFSIKTIKNISYFFCDVKIIDFIYTANLILMLILP